jgi:hypothetical protein
MEQKKKVIDYGIDTEGFLGVMAISVVEQPAIELDFIALSKVKQVTLAEDNKERRMLYGPIMIPDKLILRLDKETNEEYYIRFSKEVVRKIAYDYFKKNLHHNTTLEHTFPIVGLTLVESWLVEGKNDKSQNYGYQLEDGVWFGGMYVENDEVWSEVKEGNVKGFSVEGMFQNVAVQFLSKPSEPTLLDELETLLAKYELTRGCE